VGGMRYTYTASVSLSVVGSQTSWVGGVALTVRGKTVSSVNGTSGVIVGSCDSSNLVGVSLLLDMMAAPNVAIVSYLVVQVEHSSLACMVREALKARRRGVDLEKSDGWLD
jgi:hypothetical protein